MWLHDFHNHNLKKILSPIKRKIFIYIFGQATPFVGL